MFICTRLPKEITGDAEVFAQMFLHFSSTKRRFEKMKNTYSESNGWRRINCTLVILGISVLSFA